MITLEIKQNEGYKNRWTILLIIVLSIFMSALDASIVNAALPANHDRKPIQNDSPGKRFLESK